jgi:hypothetical protein
LDRKIQEAGEAFERFAEEARTARLVAQERERQAA